MTMQKLASDIAKLEGKKTQARIGEVREILAILSDIMWAAQNTSIEALLNDNGMKRAAKLAKTNAKKK